MSAEDKQKKIEELNKTIEEREKTLAGLKVDIQSRQKLLETLNSIEPNGNNKSLVDSLKKQEEEIGNRDKQIMVLYQRIDALQKEKDALEKGKPEAKTVDYEELSKSWEAQKVKYVEEIQNLSIELRKKDRIFDEKAKAFEAKIKDLDGKVEALEAQQAENLEEISGLKEKISEITQKKDEEIKGLTERLEVIMQENETLSEMNGKVKTMLEERDGSIQKLREDLTKSEESAQKLGGGNFEVTEMKQTIREQEQDLLAQKKELSARKLENENLEKNVNNLLQIQDEKQKIINVLNEQLEDLNSKIEGLTHEVSEYKQKELAQKQDEEELQLKKVSKSEVEVQATEEKESKDVREIVTQTDEIEAREAVIQTAELIEENEEAKITKNSVFEQRLQAVKEENEREVAKLNDLLRTSEAEKLEKIFALEEKQEKLKELEEINATFEGLIFGLKKTVLEVQERMDRNGNNLSEMQKKLDAQEEELHSLRVSEAELSSLADEKSAENERLVEEMKNKDFQIARLEKGMLHIMEESNLWKQKLKVANDKNTAYAKNQSKSLSSQLANKDNEINILKEMVKSTQGMVRAKETELMRLKQRLHLEAPTVRLPSIASNENLKKGLGMKEHLPGLNKKYDYGKYGQNIKGGEFQQITGSGYSGNFFPRLGDDRDSYPSGFDISSTYADARRSDEDEEYENSRVEKVSGVGDMKSRIKNLTRDKNELRTTETEESQKRTKKSQGNLFDPFEQGGEESLKNIISPVKVTKKKAKDVEAI